MTGATFITTFCSRDGVQGPQTEQGAFGRHSTAPHEASRTNAYHPLREASHGDGCLWVGQPVLDFDSFCFHWLDRVGNLVLHVKHWIRLPLFHFLYARIQRGHVELVFSPAQHSRSDLKHVPSPVTPIGQLPDDRVLPRLALEAGTRVLGCNAAGTILQCWSIRRRAAMQGRCYPRAYGNSPNPLTQDPWAAQPAPACKGCARPNSAGQTASTGAVRG